MKSEKYPFQVFLIFHCAKSLSEINFLDSQPFELVDGMIDDKPKKSVSHLS